MSKFSQKGFSTMNQYPVRYAFRLDPATEQALEQIARHKNHSKASIIRCYVVECAKRDGSSERWRYGNAIFSKSI